MIGAGDEDSAPRLIETANGTIVMPADRAVRGRLKIFLGAAPGVGKTYAMLRAAQQLRRDDWDVVAGLVETHGQRETEALLRGMEIVAPKPVDKRGQAAATLDVDAVLARRPQLVLVDDLAHANAPGARHPMRYMDVEELLQSGIDVYATLNIQHLESLTDTIALLTRVKVRDIVPDAVIEGAAEVELVDLTPEALLQRLKEGKVALPEQTQKTIRQSFSPANLTALRELALRCTAERVDRDMAGFRLAQDGALPVAVGDRVLVCIDEGINQARLVRAGRRISDRLRARWSTVYVEGPRHGSLSEVARDRIAETLRLAERLGSDVATIPGPGIAEALLRYAKEHSVTHLVAGRTRRLRLVEALRGSVLQDLLKRAGPIDVTILATEEPTPPRRRRLARAWQPRMPRLGSYLIGLGSVSAVTAIATAFGSATSLANLAIMYLAAILISALTAGLGPALFTTFASILAHNYFFVGRFDFDLTDYNEIVSLVMFVAVAVLASNLMSRLRAQAVDARRRERTTAALYAFSRKLAGVAVFDDLLWAIVHQIAAMLKVRVVLLLPDAGRLAIRAGYPPEDDMAEHEWQAARWAFDHNVAAGRGTDTMNAAERIFLPLRTASGVVGAIGIDRPGGALLAANDRRLLDSLADQAAMAVERLQLAIGMDEARLAAATERLKSALLTSVSQDLRAPLAAINGAATSLLGVDGLDDATARREKLMTIQEEGDRLARFITNLLDMTRLETGALGLNPARVTADRLVDGALKRSQRLLQRHTVERTVSAALPELVLDYELTEQSLVNLLDNAAKYSPPGSTIAITASRAGDRLIVEVGDQGIGIAAADSDLIFDKFYRVHAGERHRAGTGLGLSIARGFIELQGGRLGVRSHGPGTGTVFQIDLPLSIV